MATIDELTPEQIRSPEIFQKIKNLGNSFIARAQAKEAYFLQEKLETLLSQSDLQKFNPELYKNYYDLLIALKWVALPLLPEEKVLNVLSHNFLAVLDNEDINIQERMEAKMFTLGLLPRNQFRQKMQKALQENNENIGKHTIGEWIIGYIKMFSPENRSDLSPSEYIMKNPEARMLSEAEKNKLKKTLKIFDQTLLATPVMSEPLFSITVRKMIKAGTIKRPVNPALLKYTSLPKINIPTKAPEKKKEKEAKQLIKQVPAPKPEKEKKAAPVKQKPVPKPEKVKEKKPGLFERLFGKKPEEPKKEEPISTTRTKEKTGKEKEVYEKEISPYAKKRKTISKKIPVPKKEEEEESVPSSVETEIPEIPADLEKANNFEIRTMKKDVKEAKEGSKKPIPEKPKTIPDSRQAKVKDNNIVDLSRK